MFCISNSGKTLIRDRTPKTNKESGLTKFMVHHAGRRGKEGLTSYYINLCTTIMRVFFKMRKADMSICHGDWNNWGHKDKYFKCVCPK